MRGEGQRGKKAMDGMVPALGCAALCREVAVGIYFRQKESPDLLGTLRAGLTPLSTWPWAPRPGTRYRFIPCEKSCGEGGIGNTCCGAGAQQACSPTVSFQMRTARARATLTTGSKVRCGSPRAWKPFPALALGNKPSLPPCV